MSRLISVSAPDELHEGIEALARRQGRTKSEFVREALREQVLLGRWDLVREQARRQAELHGIGPEEVEDLVDEIRGNRA